jgi:hypothetical protein
MPRMPSLARTATLLAALMPALLPALARAQDTAPRGGEPKVEVTVTEDDGVRIEELRVRGQTQRIVVRSKLGNAAPYEILPAQGGRDLSQDKRAIGQRVWSVLSF